MKMSKQIAPDLDALSRKAAEFVTERAEQAVEKRGRFSLVLAGGGTPRGLYERLAAEPFRSRIEWDRWHLFQGDERCVPPGDPESNYGLARAALISKVPIPAANVHRMEAEKPGPVEAAEAYERELRGWFDIPRSQSGKFPAFDLLLLGIGGDGHVASLFPDNLALKENMRWVVEAEAPSIYLTRDRISLTLPVLNSAACVAILAAGAGKREVLGRIFQTPPPGAPGLPASMVRPASGELVWLLDRAADPA